MFENSIDNLNHPRYLGSSKVVDGLIRDFVAGVMNAGSEDALMSVCNRYADIFSGVDSSYVQVEGWANRSKLGHQLEIHVNVEPGQSFVDMVRTTFVIWASELMQAVVESGGSVVDVQPKIDAFIGKAVAVLMGTASMQMVGERNAG